MRFRSLLRRESGQTIAMVAVCLPVLFGATALTVDLGNAWSADRQLQRAVDAAATAAAQELPSASRAAAAARTVFDQNRVGNARDLKLYISTQCTTIVPGCANPVNGRQNVVQITAKAKTDTFFARIFGRQQIDLGARATACAPCSTAPVDLMIVWDRTTSMSATDMANARDGIRTLLSFMSSRTAKVGLAVFPPKRPDQADCTAPPQPYWTGNSGTYRKSNYPYPDSNPTKRSNSTSYDDPNAEYIIAPMSFNWKASNGTLDSSHELIAAINCMPTASNTSYAVALDKAQKELHDHGRNDIDDVIIFVTDGGANTGNWHFSASSPYRTRPCWQGLQSANAAKAAGTRVITIGYDIESGCETDRGSGTETPAQTPEAILRAMATNPTDFFNQPDPASLRTIFTEVAAEIFEGQAGLMDSDKTAPNGTEI